MPRLLRTPSFVTAVTVIATTFLSAPAAGAASGTVALPADTSATAAESPPWTPDAEPSPDDVAGRSAVRVPPHDAHDHDLTEDAARPLAALLVPTAPVRTLPTLVDAFPGYQRTVSCDPTTRPGVVAFAQLVSTHYGKPRYFLSRACKAGDFSQHYDGRAVDWPLNAFDAADKAIGDAAVSWLTAGGGEIAKRFGIMYIIWDRKIWYSHRPAAWEAYTGVSPHTDHIHFSFTWDGAMKRTSWWTGAAVLSTDQGPCRVFEGQYAPRYTGPRKDACPSTLPPPPPSPYPVYLPGASHPDIELAQVSFRMAPSAIDGTFGPATLSELLKYQRDSGLPVTGVLDNATWVTLEALKPRAPFTQIVAATDVSDDHRADLVTVDSTGRLHVFPGRGTGRLERARPFGLGWSELDVYAPGDWDRDGNGDLVTVDPDGGLFLYRGDGGGGFRARQPIGHGWSGFRIVPAGDVNGDTRADLLAIDPQQRLWLYPGDGRGGFQARKQVGNGWTGFDLHSAGDMNRDGRADILSIDSAGRLWFYGGRGDGSFLARNRVGYGWTGYSFASGGDFDGNGITDLMGRDPQGRLWFYSGRIGGTFAMKVQVGNGW